jgi:hypothetical protein
MADRFGRMQIAVEVTALQRKVGCDKHFTSSGRAQNCAVIADAERYCLVADGEIAANLLDQAQLSHRLERLFHPEGSINGGSSMPLLWELRHDPIVTLWLREGTQFVTLTKDAHESIALLN